LASSPSPNAQPVVTIVAAIAADVDIRWMTEMTTRSAVLLSTPVHRVAVRIIGDAEMTALHERHLGLSHTTDVLTFPLHEPGEPVDVDIAVCIDEARRQAEQRGHPCAQELLLYVIHGLLHCADHDDHDDADARRMHAEEDRILGALGVGATFGRRAAEDAAS